MTIPRTTAHSPEFKPPDSYIDESPGEGKGDSRTGGVYVFNDKVRLAVQVALATGRPLLVRGESGWGKSSLAAAAARYLHWNFFEIVITSRTQARDLQWEVDLLLRLNDAQAQRLDADLRRYIRPGILWRAFQPADAEQQQQRYTGVAVAPTPVEPAFPSAGAVILIDEIDKADPDVPNNLLVALGSLEFRVEETGQIVRADKTRPPLVFITTNEERELPLAFLRRCVEIRLPALSTDDRDGSIQKRMLVDIVLAHGVTHAEKAVSREYLEKVIQLLVPAPAAGEAATIPSPAEFKDTVLALVDRFGVDEVPEKDLRDIAQMTLTKRRAARG